VVEFLVQGLSKHGAVEALVVYPLAKRMPQGDRAIDECLRRQTALLHLLRALDRLVGESQSEVNDRLIAELRHEFEWHVREDEGSLLPGLHKAVDQQMLDDLGAALEQAGEVAPARPHPNAPNRLPEWRSPGPSRRFSTGYGTAGTEDRVRDSQGLQLRLCGDQAPRRIHADV
jgi:hypothetical protein